MRRARPCPRWEVVEAVQVAVAAVVAAITVTETGMATMETATGMAGTAAATEAGTGNDGPLWNLGHRPRERHSFVFLMDDWRNQALASLRLPFAFRLDMPSIGLIQPSIVKRDPDDYFDRSFASIG